MKTSITDGKTDRQTKLLLKNDENFPFKTDIMISDDKRMVPEGKDFKIVFISSESKSGSELNSSMECDPAGRSRGLSQPRVGTLPFIQVAELQWKVFGVFGIKGM